MITKVNYKVALLFALLIVCCSVFLVGFTDNDTALAATESWSVNTSQFVDNVYTFNISSLTKCTVTVVNDTGSYKPFNMYYRISASNLQVSRYYPTFYSIFNNTKYQYLGIVDFPILVAVPNYSSSGGSSVTFQFGGDIEGSSYVFSCSITIELVPYSELSSGSGPSYDDGFQAGIEYANGTVNEESASYSAGYNSGIEYANGTVNEESASYIAGFSAGQTLDYKDGYQAGIEYANSVVTTDSASYKAGYQAGYAAGLAVGSASAENGIWSYASLELKVQLRKIADNSGLITLDKVIINVNPFLNNYSVDFAGIYNFCENKFLTSTYITSGNVSDYYISYVDVYIRFKYPFNYDFYSYPFSGSGFKSLNGGQATFVFDNDSELFISVNGISSGTSNFTLNGSFDNFTNSVYGVNSNIGSTLVRGIRVVFNYINPVTNEPISNGWKPVDSMANASLSTGNAGYAAGYQSGYQSGYVDGTGYGIEQGQASEQNNIYLKGYNDGYNSGIADSNDYSFNGLISAVIDVPVKTFTSLFDWNFLGVNLKPVVLSLLSICLFVAIWKLFSRLGG